MSATVKPGIALPADEMAAAHGVSFAEAFKVWLRLEIFAALLAVAAALAIFRFKVGIIQTLLACSLAGMVLQLSFGVAQ